MTAPAPKANLADTVYATLKREIHEFNWIPGDRLSEAELGLRLGVSRTPVREALLRLRNEGFLEVEAKTGWFVKPIDFARLDQLYDLRVVLECASLARLGSRVDDPPELVGLQAAWLVPPGQRLQDAREEALRAIGDLAGEPKGLLRMTCAVAYSERFVVPLVNSFMERHPQ
ncbi:MAG: GntR family transcriptional regulator, partial [Rubrivivax sp.]